MTVFFQHWKGRDIKCSLIGLSFERPYLIKALNLMITKTADFGQKSMDFDWFWPERRSESAKTVDFIQNPWILAKSPHILCGFEFKTRKLLISSQNPLISAKSHGFWVELRSESRKTTDFGQKFVDFDGFWVELKSESAKTADFSQKSTDFADFVWFLSLKLENCWLILSPEKGSKGKTSIFPGKLPKLQI